MKFIPGRHSWEGPGTFWNKQIPAMPTFLATRRSQAAGIPHHWHLPGLDKGQEYHPCYAVRC